MKTSKSNFWLTIALFVTFLWGTALRLYQLDVTGGILNRDEAALAYNAYLIADSGLDEWHRSMPIVFESFGDFKLPGYIYTLAAVYRIAPSLIFDDYVVRIPAALAGSGLILVGYFFARRLGSSRFIAYLFALCIACSPVFILYSKFAYEAMLALFLFVVSLLIFTANHNPNRWRRFIVYILGCVTYLLACLTYNTPLLLVPVALLIVAFSAGITNYKHYVAQVILIFLTAIVVYLLTSTAISQKKGITIFSDATIASRYAEINSSIQNPILGVLFNSISYFSWLVLSRMLHFFGYSFLVSRGGQHPWHQIIGQSHLFPLQYLLIGVGILTGLGALLQSSTTQIRSTSLRRFLNLLPSRLSFSHSASTRFGLLFLLLLVSLAPASVTVDAPHATRSLFSIFLLVLAALTGFELIIQHVSAKALILGTLFITAYFLISSAAYTERLVSTFSTQNAQSLYPYLASAMQNVDFSPKIAILDDSNFSYILFAWYGRVASDVFHATAQRSAKDKIGFSYCEKVGPYQFIHHTEQAQGYISVFRWKNGQWQLE